MTRCRICELVINAEPAEIGNIDDHVHHFESARPDITALTTPTLEALRWARRLRAQLGARIRRLKPRLVAATEYAHHLSHILQTDPDGIA